MQREPSAWIERAARALASDGPEAPIESRLAEGTRSARPAEIPREPDHVPSLARDAAPPEDLAPLPAFASPKIERASATSSTEARRPSADEHTRPPSIDASDAHEIAGTSEYAGLAYLVAALQSPEAQEAIDELGLLGTAPHGWHLIVGLARLLDTRADDPFLFALSSLVDDGGTRELANAPAMATLATRLSARYGADLFDARLVAVAGRFRLDRTHLDVFMPLDSVRIEVRLAALDVNPGWVSWLGRVVTIHYEAKA
jgi:hypothetical protein